MSAVLDMVGVRVERDAGVLLDVPAWGVAAGELAVVVGATDSGKTLLAAVLAGRVEPSAGRVSVRGRRLGGRPSQRRRHGLAATVGDGRRLAGCTVTEALRLAGRGRASAALERFPLLGRRRDLGVELLSGGEHGVLQAACAWCAAPAVLVLDGPTTGLAEDAAGQVRRLAIEAAREGTAVVWLDQDLATAPPGARWWLQGGRLRPAAAEASPATPPAAADP